MVTIPEESGLRYRFLPDAGDIVIRHLDNDSGQRNQTDRDGQIIRVLRESFSPDPRFHGEHIPLLIQ